LSQPDYSQWWFYALVLFVVAATIFDTQYVMPNYLPSGLLTGERVYSPDTSMFIQYAFSFFKILIGIPLILLHLGSPNLAFGAGFWGTAASSALVAYTLLIPYLAVLLFVIPGASGVPPAYRFFSFFITRSGAKHIDRSLGERGTTFDVNAFDRETSQPRRDKYQARMETEQLEKVAERARAQAAKTREEVGRYSAEEEARTRAKVDAADAAEEAFRMKARKRAWERRRKDR